MVASTNTTTTMAWLSEFKRSLSASASAESRRRPEKPATLGILAFDTAKVMARLVSLHKTLSDDEILKLRRDVMRSKGVSRLNSKDQAFLLYLACAEVLEDLDSAALTVARLGRRCADFSLSRFDLVYNDLKMGIIDLSKMKFASRDAGKVMEKMERTVHATANLYTALESLTEMEISERKLQMWRRNATEKATNFDLFDEKISYQRRQVRSLREASLWSQTFDKAVGLMARAVCAVYARVCAVFGPYISVLPSISSRFTQSPPFQYKPQICALPQNGRASKSGPIAITPKQRLTRAFSRKSSVLFSDNVGFGVGFGIGYDESRSFFRFDEMGKHNSAYKNAPPSTVGGSGLALRYANVIILTERYLNTASSVLFSSIGDNARGDLYQMLPASLRAAVRWKLKEEKTAPATAEEWWRVEVEETMGWLAPMAHDTVKRQAARNMEKQMFEGKPTVLLLQTLHYADRDKTEAAMAEVLVGLSCICRHHHQHRRRGFDASRLSL